MRKITVSSTDDIIKPCFHFHDITILSSDWLTHFTSCHLPEISWFFAPFLNANGSQVFISSQTPILIGRAFSPLSWTSYALNLPWPSQVLGKQDTSCWALRQPVSMPYILFIIWHLGQWCLFAGRMRFRCRTGSCSFFVVLVQSRSHLAGTHDMRLYICGFPFLEHVTSNEVASGRMILFAMQ